MKSLYCRCTRVLLEASSEHVDTRDVARVISCFLKENVSPSPFDTGGAVDKRSPVLVTARCGESRGNPADLSAFNSNPWNEIPVDVYEC